MKFISDVDGNLLEWSQKCMAELKFYLEHFNGSIGCFIDIAVLFVKLDEFGEVGF